MKKGEIKIVPNDIVGKRLVSCMLSLTAGQNMTIHIPG